MRHLLSVILAIFIIGCAPNTPVTLVDDLGEVDTPEVVTLDQIEFTCADNFEAQLDRCLSMHDPGAGVHCDPDTAIAHLDGNIWDLSTEWAEYNIDSYEERYVFHPEDVEVIHASPPKARFAECSCPAGCNAAQCKWEENEDGNYVCEGDCQGSFCTHCTVLLTDDPATDHAPS